jgi:hypothetical protein
VAGKLCRVTVAACHAVVPAGPALSCADIERHRTASCPATTGGHQQARAKRRAAGADRRRLEIRRASAARADRQYIDEGHGGRHDELCCPPV